MLPLDAKLPISRTWMDGSLTRSRRRCHTQSATSHVSSHDPADDPVPGTVTLNLDEAFRVLEALEDARLALRERGAAPGLQDELATVIRILHGKLGLDEGGVL